MESMEEEETDSREGMEDEWGDPSALVATVSPSWRSQ